MDDLDRKLQHEVNRIQRENKTNLVATIVVLAYVFLGISLAIATNF